MRKAGNAKKLRPREAKAISQTQLDELIEEATVDCYNESEQISGFFCVLEERVKQIAAKKLARREARRERRIQTVADQEYSDS